MLFHRSRRPACRDIGNPYLRAAHGEVKIINKRCETDQMIKRRSETATGDKDIRDYPNSVSQGAVKQGDVPSSRPVAVPREIVRPVVRHTLVAAAKPVTALPVACGIAMKT